MRFIKELLTALWNVACSPFRHKTPSPTPAAPAPAQADTLEPMIVELIVSADEEEMVMEIAIGLEETGLVLDHSYLPVPLRNRRYEDMDPGDCVYVVRGKIEKGKIAKLKARDEVGYVWIDAPVQAMDEGDDLAF